VAGKIQNSRRVVGRWRRDASGVLASALETRHEVLTERAGRVASAESFHYLLGIEGDAARAHFTALGMAVSGSQFSFTARRRRPPRDPVNAMLGFAYGLLVSEVTGAIQAVGLDHQLGFLHRPRSGRPSLALDLVEEFRPLADRFVVSRVRRRQCGPEDFETTPGGAVYLTDGGRRAFLEAWDDHRSQTLRHRLLDRDVERWALPAVQATLLARCLRGDLPGYPPFVLEH
jgi:CRISPR-associated protein Cas1